MARRAALAALLGLSLSALAVMQAQTIAAAWLAMAAAHGSGCGGDLDFDYGSEGGMRNFFCRGLTVFSWKHFLALAPMQPFLSGPHRDGRLDFHSATSFGRYDPEFVRWAVGALVPAAHDPALRAKTQGVYDEQVRKLARTYYAVWRSLDADPGWVDAERRTYAAARQRGHSDWSTPEFDLYNDVLGDETNDWGGYDPNHVRSATLWWLRRYEDGTASLWVGGLRTLLGTYDRPWLDSTQAAPAHPPPHRAVQQVPEYQR
ncbi:MAG TPA: hypothetical protein VMB50_17555 [Myxococcales bacterium]|nr:hypothetical protein [Myxococcales bacterium]